MECSSQSNKKRKSNKNAKKDKIVIVCRLCNYLIGKCSDSTKIYWNNMNLVSDCIWINEYKNQWLSYTNGKQKIWGKNSTCNVNNNESISHLGIDLAGNMQDMHENTSELLRA